MKEIQAYIQTLPVNYINIWKVFIKIINKKMVNDMPRLKIIKNYENILIDPLPKSLTSKPLELHNLVIKLQQDSLILAVAELFISLF